MIRVLVALSLFFSLSCQDSTTYYIVRHAEKEKDPGMGGNPPLSAEGEKQAADLKNFLQDKNIKAIYATDYIRTVATAEPLRKALGLTVKFYDAKNSAQLATELKNLNGNVLVVGHSNTVDDMVNSLLGKNAMSDLPDTAYGNVFIVERKGDKYSFDQLKVPQTTPRQ